MESPVDLDYPSSVEALQPIRAEWKERIVPATVEPLAHNPYTPEYDWMFAYEKRFQRRLEECLGRKLPRVWGKALFGGDGVVSEGLSNAYVHAHRRDGTKALEVSAAVGRKGLGLAIRDQGPGFDYRTVLEQAARGADGFYHQAGNGMRALLLQPGLRFSFSDGGRTLCLLIEFEALGPKTLRLRAPDDA